MKFSAFSAVRSYWFPILGIAVVLLSFWVRWRGIDWGLPDVTWAEEEAVIDETHSISIKEGQFYIEGLRGFWYGPAYSNLLAIVLFIFDRWVVAQGFFGSIDLVPEWTHYLVGRVLSTFISVGTIAVVVFFFKDLFGKIAALVAGFFYGLNQTLLDLSIQVKSDTLCLLFSTLTIYLSFRLITNRSWLPYLAGGVFYGIAVTSKLFAVGLFAPLLAGHILAQEGSTFLRQLGNAVKDRRWLVLPAATAGGYIIGNPQCIIYIGKFWEIINQILFGEYMSEANRTYSTASEVFGRIQGIYHTLLLPGYHSSYPVIIFALTGLVLLWVRQRNMAIIIFVTWLSINIFLLPAAAAYGSPSHYLFIVPIFALLIGVALDSILKGLPRIRFMYLRLPLYVVLIAGVVFSSSHLYAHAIREVDLHTGHGEQSRRSDFRKWMMDHIPPGARIAFDFYGKILMPGYFDVVRLHEKEEGLEYYSQHYDYVVFNQWRLNDYRVYQDLFETAEPLAVFYDNETNRYIGTQAIYGLTSPENVHHRIRNFYTEALQPGLGRETTFLDPSFEADETSKNWGVRLFNTYKDGRIIEWWDGEEGLSNINIERDTTIVADGGASLHITLSEPIPASESGKEWLNTLSDADSRFEIESNWNGTVSHSVSRVDDGNAYEGNFALKVVSSGYVNDGEGAYLTMPFIKYKNGQANKLIFYARSESGKKKLRVRSGDDTWANFTLSEKYERYEIVGSALVPNNMIFALEDAGVCYLDSIVFLTAATEKKVQIGQVVPYDFLNRLQDFSFDYYVHNPDQVDVPGAFMLNVIAESLGGHYLKKETYILYDAGNKSQHFVYNQWHTFRRNIKRDFSRPFSRWGDIEFITITIEVQNPNFGNIDIFIDNIQTSEIQRLKEFNERMNSYKVTNN